MFPDTLILPFVCAFVAGAQLVLFAIVLMCGPVARNPCPRRAHARHLSICCWVLWWAWFAYLMFYAVRYNGRWFFDVQSDIWSAVAVQCVVCLVVYYVFVFVESVTAFRHMNLRTFPPVNEIMEHMKSSAPALSMRAVCWHYTLSGCTINEHQPRQTSQVIELPFIYDSWYDITNKTLPVARHGLTRINVQVVVRMGDAYTQQCFDTAFLKFSQGNCRRDYRVDFSVVHSLAGDKTSEGKYVLTCSNGDSIPRWISMWRLVVAALFNVALLYRAAMDLATVETEFSVAKSVVMTPRHPPQPSDGDGASIASVGREHVINTTPTGACNV